MEYTVAAALVHALYDDYVSSFSKENVPSSFASLESTPFGRRLLDIQPLQTSTPNYPDDDMLLISPVVGRSLHETSGNTVSSDVSVKTGRRNLKRMLEEREDKELQIEDDDRAVMEKRRNEESINVEIDKENDEAETELPRTPSPVKKLVPTDHVATTRTLPKTPARSRQIREKSVLDESVFNRSFADSVYTQGDADLSMFSQMTTVNGVRAGKTRKFWNDMHRIQHEWLKRITSGTFNLSELIYHLLQSWKLLTKTCCSFAARPMEIQKSMQMYSVSAVKLYEFLTLRGTEEIASQLMDFIQTVLARFIAQSERMTELSSLWTQSREILRLVCSAPTNLEILLTVRSIILEIELKYIKQQTADASSRDSVAMAYILEQLQDLAGRVHNRIQQAVRRQKHCLMF